jgi:hypothetical protein
MISFSNDSRIAEEQMHAVIFYLTAFGYIDGDFDQDEKRFVRDYISNLVDARATQSLRGEHLAMKDDITTRWTKHFHEVLDEVDHQILSHFTESVAEGEDTRQFVIAKLKLRCYELFKKFDEDNRQALLATVDELMHADGVVHPNELNFRNELFELLEAPMDLDDSEIEHVKEGEVVVNAARKLAPREDNHPFFQRFEWDYAMTDPDTLAKQAQGEIALIHRTMAKLDEQRQKGKGRLSGVQDVSEFAGQEPFFDGHIYVLPANAEKDYELLVLGDLHGCYSCLKGALLQADFFGKVQAFHDDPVNNPDVKLVLLGDYIDRGRFSYNGVLRTVMQLFLTVPEHVYMLRGNHEYYVELNGRIYGGVRPAEAINSLQDVAPEEIFHAYRDLFDSLPNMLLFDRMLFVHAGIPRDDTMAQKWMGLESLNDPEIRFQMLWSDPSEAEFIPLDLQKSNARFPFGRRQFKSFMSRLGATLMVRGHERIVEGFKKIYDDADAKLFNLFSAGGKNNNDLPPNSNYREVTPMALTIRQTKGVVQMTPFIIDYERYNDPEFNAFFKGRVALSSHALVHPREVLALREDASSLGEDLAAVLRDEDGVLELGGERAIAGEDGPLVVEDLNVVAADVDHGLDGEDHARLQAEPFAPLAVVRDRRGLVEFPADAVAGVVPHHAEAEAVRVLGDGGADVADARVLLHLRDAEGEAVAGGLGDLDGVLGRRAHVERCGRVPVEAFEERRDVDVDDVAVLQHLAAGDAVAHDRVDAGADALGKAVVVERRRTRAPTDRVLVDDAVDLLRRHADAELLPDELERLGCHPAGDAHALDLTRRLDVDAHGWATSCNAMASFAAATVSASSGAR